MYKIKYLFFLKYLKIVKRKKQQYTLKLFVFTEVMRLGYKS